MKTLVATGHGAGLATTAGATAYAPVATCLLGTNATEALRQFRWREVGGFRRARVNCTANTASSSSTFTLRVGGADTAVAVSIGAGATGWFEDTLDDAGVADGQLVDWSIVAGATTGPTFGAAVVEFEPTDGTAAISPLAWAGPITFTTASATRYLVLAGRMTSAPTSTEAQVQLPSPVAGTLRNLHAYVSANARTTTTTLRMRKNTANGGQTLSIGSTATGLFEDTSGTDTIAVGDLICGQFVTGTGTNSITIDTMGVTLESTTGAAFQTGHGAGLSNTTASITRYLQVGGDLGSSFGHSTEANAQTKHNEGTWSRLSAYVSANSRTTTTTITTRKNGADTVQTVSIGSTATGLFQDTSDTFTTVSDDLVDHAITWGTGSQSQTLMFVGIGFTSDVAVPRFGHVAGQAVGRASSW